MAEALLTLQGVSKYYTANQSVVMGLNNVDLTFRSGEFVAITGESGSGKSTLAHVISGILPYESGEMCLNGKPTSHFDSGDWERYRRENISFISQNYGILPGSSVLTNVVSALRITGLSGEESRQRARELLELVELWQLRSRKAGKLSSGQKQRLSIARALAKPAPVLVADEPTGNLDPENSVKILQLLARAAKERLVILITHDFQEAEQLVSRRIILQDGRVTVDSPLQPLPEAPAHRPPERKKQSLSPFVTWLQITGRPVWSALVLLFFALTAFGVFSFLGTFIMNLDDTATRIYDDSAFTNGDQQRIVVQRQDLQPMTEADWNTILAVANADSLERSGYLTDWQYAYREGRDYDMVYTVQHRGNDDNAYVVNRGTAMLNPAFMDFVRTVPLFADGREFLTAGRLPQTMYEVVLAGKPDQIGTTMPIYLYCAREWGSGSYIHLDVTVVGVTKYGEGVYFADELGSVIGNYMAGGGVKNGMFLIAPAYDSFATLDAAVVQNDFLTAGRLPTAENEVVVPGTEELIGTYLACIDARIVGVTNQGAGVYYTRQIDPSILENENLSDAERAIVSSLVNELFLRTGHKNIEDSEDGAAPDWVKLYVYDESVCALAEPLYARRAEAAALYEEPITAVLYDISDPNADITDRDNYVYMDVVGYNDSTFTGFVSVTPELFGRISRQGNANQVSLTITDYAYTDQVIEDLQEEGYLAISVFRQGATRKHPVLASRRMTTLQVCLAALAAVVLLQILVLRELFGIQRESYKLLADMGLGCGTAQRSVLWQVLLFALCGQAVGFGAIGICSAVGVQRIVSIVRYLPAANWLILSGVHLIVSALTGLLVMKGIRKTVYPQSARRGDLNMDEEAA